MSLYDALRNQGYTGAMNDMLRRYYLDNGAVEPGNMNDLERQMLISQGYTTGSNQDMWMQFFADQGYTGALADRMQQFVDSGAAFTVPGFVSLNLNESGYSPSSQPISLNLV